MMKAWSDSFALPLIAGIAFLVPSAGRGAEKPRIQPDVVYGHKDGMALTFDVVRPEKPSGAAILFIQSGGWYSVYRDPAALLPACQPFLGKGMTVFIVRHGSAPRYMIPEIVGDVRRCVRFIRMRAADFGVKPDRLGVLGGSAGGHLTLVLATTGDDGDPKSPDPVLRQSSRIAAGVALYPPTDLREWVTNPPPEIKRLAVLKPPLSFPAAQAPAVSPILHVSPDDAPILLIHGDRDTLVPIEHSRKMLAACQKVKAVCELLEIKDGGHSFTPAQSIRAAPAMVNWFVKHLGSAKTGAAP